MALRISWPQETRVRNPARILRWFHLAETSGDWESAGEFAEWPVRFESLLKLLTQSGLPSVNMGKGSFANSVHGGP